MNEHYLEWVDLGEVPYLEAVGWMETWVRERQEGLIGDRLVLLNHPAVITYGGRTPRNELPLETEIPLIEVNRGGQATYHGPGQLMGYLIVDLRRRGPGDVVRWLETGLISALNSLGLQTIRRETPTKAQSLVGVWTSEHRKVASIGMRIRGGVTSHGFALNVAPDLAAFSQFTACGLPTVVMTSIAEMSASAVIPVPPEEAVRAAVAAALGAVRTTPTPRRS